MLRLGNWTDQSPKFRERELKFPYIKGKMREVMTGEPDLCSDLTMYMKRIDYNTCGKRFCTVHTNMMSLIIIKNNIKNDKKYFVNKPVIQIDHSKVMD